MEDPKKKAGDLKAPLHLLPTVAMRETAYVLDGGAVKYGVYNWRESDGVKATTYIAAMLRHLTQYTDGEDKDEESGRSHLAHIMATCSILLDAGQVGKLIDDRPKIKIAEQWNPPCNCFQVCQNAKAPVVCGSCVERPDGWTNFKKVEG